MDAQVHLVDVDPNTTPWLNRFQVNPIEDPVVRKFIMNIVTH